jgi:hypothetical protein
LCQIKSCCNQKLFDKLQKVSYSKQKLMGTPITSYELQRRLDIAKKREAAREAARLAATPAPYAPKDIGGSAYFRSIENENLFVEMPFLQKQERSLRRPLALLGAIRLPK